MATLGIEQGRSSNVEVKMTRDITPQEIAERTGGKLHATAGGFNIAIAYEHLDEKLEVYMERPHGETRDRPSMLSFPITADQGKVAMKVRLADTVTILRPDSVSFIVMQSPDLRPGSKPYPIEFLIAPDGFSCNMHPGLQSPEIAQAVKLLIAPVK